MIFVPIGNASFLPCHAQQYEKKNIIIFIKLEIIVIFSFFRIIVLNPVGKCPKSYNSEHYSLIMGNKHLCVTIMTHRIRGL